LSGSQRLCLRFTARAFRCPGLPLLATHLTYPEIAAELFLSPHTVKSQAYSLFRKLPGSSARGVSQRHRARQDRCVFTTFTRMTKVPCLNCGWR
jgi:hypothetical protein